MTVFLIKNSFQSVVHLCGSYTLWIRCMRSSLSCRSRLVSNDGTKSSIFYHSVTSWVPQDSILDPLLFLIYVNDLSNCFSTSALLQFADDCKCHSRIHLCSWSSKWSLSFDVSKCKALHFFAAQKSTSSVYQYCIDDVLIQ